MVVTYPVRLMISVLQASKPEPPNKSNRLCFARSSAQPNLLHLFFIPQDSQSLPRDYRNRRESLHR